MKIVAAYLLAVIGGNDAPDAAAINTILDSVGSKAEAANVELFLKEVAGKNLDELIEAGTAKLASVGGGGGGGGGAAAPAAGGKAAAAPVEESSDEPEEEEDGFSLFD